MGQNRPFPTTQGNVSSKADVQHRASERPGIAITGLSRDALIERNRVLHSQAKSSGPTEWQRSGQPLARQ